MLGHGIGATRNKWSGEGGGGIGLGLGLGSELLTHGDGFCCSDLNGNWAGGSVLSGLVG